MVENVESLGSEFQTHTFADAEVLGCREIERPRTRTTKRIAMSHSHGIWTKIREPDCRIEYRSIRCRQIEHVEAVHANADWSSRRITSDRCAGNVSRPPVSTSRVRRICAVEDAKRSSGTRGEDARKGIATKQQMRPATRLLEPWRFINRRNHHAMADVVIRISAIQPRVAWIQISQIPNSARSSLEVIGEGRA